MPHTKVANPILEFLARIARKPAVRELAGLGAGVGVGEGVTRMEMNALRDSGLNPGHIAESGSRLVNYPLFGLLGTRFGRGGLLQRAGQYDPLKILNSFVGKGLLTGVPIIADQAAQLTGHVNDAAKGMGDLGSATSRAANTLEDTVKSIGHSASKGSAGFGVMGDSLSAIDKNTVNRLVDVPQQLSNTLQKLPRNVAIAGGAALGGVGAYTLFRDWLQNRREQENQKHQPLPTTQPKVAAAWDVARRLLGVGAGAGAEAYMTKDLDMDPIARGAAITMGGLSGLKWTSPGAHAYAGPGGADLASKNFLWTLGGFTAPRLLDAAQKGNTALGIANVKSKMDLTGAGGSNLWRNLGLTALGGAGLYALTQVGRAAKRVGDGEPIATSSPNGPAIHVGGGSPTLAAIDNESPQLPEPAPATEMPNGPAPATTPHPSLTPGSGGMLRVMLPTRSDRDHETQVEIPLEEIGLSNAIMTKIRRDTKRRLRFEGDERTHHIVPGRPNVFKMGLLRELFVGATTFAQ